MARAARTYGLTVELTAPPGLTRLIRIAVEYDQYHHMAVASACVYTADGTASDALMIEKRWQIEPMKVRGNKRLMLLLEMFRSDVTDRTGPGWQFVCRACEELQCEVKT